MAITTVDYLKAIKHHIIVAKQHDTTGILHRPSPAQLRNYCILLFDHGLSVQDDITFRHFFQVGKEDDLRKAMQQFDVDKLKSIQKFIEGTIESPNLQNLEFISVLLDFQPRPYGLFSKKELVIQPKNSSAVLAEKEVVLLLKKGYNSYKKIITGILIIISLCFGYVTKELFFPPKDCMQWNGDHYELVDCSTYASGKSSTVQPIIKNEIGLKKIIPTDTTLFFKDGKAVVWYCKSKDSIEFFNSFGTHPLNGKALRPVTHYIINKYLKKK